MIRHARHAQITKSQDLRKGLSSFAYLLRVVTNPWIMLRLPCSFSWVLYGMPKVLRNNKLPISLERVEWFCWFFVCSYLHMVRYPPKLQKYAILGWQCQAWALSQSDKLKKLYEVSCWFFSCSWIAIETTNISCYFGLWTQNTIGQ